MGVLKGFYTRILLKIGLAGGADKVFEGMLGEGLAGEVPRVRQALLLRIDRPQICRYVCMICMYEYSLLRIDRPQICGNPFAVCHTQDHTAPHCRVSSTHAHTWWSKRDKARGWDQVVGT